MKKAIVLCSGGLDSVTTAYYVKKSGYSNIIMLFFDYGQKTFIKERECSKKCAKNIGANFIEVDLKWLGKISYSLINKKGKINRISIKDLKNSNIESKRYYVPCRNSMFLMYALSIAESEFVNKKNKYDIFVGFKCEGKEAYADTTKEFVKEMNELAKISCSSEFKIIAPLIKKDKEDIIILGKSLGVDFKDTFSCYVGKNKHCGTCLACRLRQEGFYWANLKDPTEYKEKMKDFRRA